MANDAPLNPYEPPLKAEVADSANPVEPAAPRPWGPWATVGWTLLVVAALIGVQTVVAVAFVVAQLSLGQKLDPAELTSNGNLISLASLAAAPVVVGLAALLIRLRGCSLAAYLALVWPTMRGASMAVAGLVVLLAATDLTTWLLSRPIVPPFMDDAYRTASLPLLLLALLFGAPLTEETLFRGFFFHGIANSRWGPIPAIVLSSLLWASLHLQYDLFSIGSIIVLGLYLGWVRYRSGSLLLTMFLHFVTNTSATLEAALKAHGVF